MNQTLKGSVPHFSNVDSRASINKGQCNSINSNVIQIGSKSQTSCSLLLELYIIQKINERQQSEQQRICY